ncbi:hypothetical protein DFQ28_010219 [Apophysomyces sp. BC1034]|nr:hypothetical protein DFQ30_009851 [Apophysomyces sp. BC1015]KAG0170210.1 hypothetical protein DFQ29_009379 [Apophysomyces sp. BC1021]KAG0184932.1 hypothetical protein DFQ28_010219 [Apophysomyces sp. BC1034]
MDGFSFDHSVLFEGLDLNVPPFVLARSLQTRSSSSSSRRRLLPEHTRQEFAEKYPYFTTKEADVAYRKCLKMEPSFGEAEKFIIAYSTVKRPPIEADIDPDDYIFVRSGPHAQMAHLNLFNRPDEPRPMIEELTQAYEHVLSLLDVPNKEPFPERWRLAAVIYEPDKFAGIDYALRGLAKRREAETLAQKDAELAYDRLMAGLYVEPHRARMGGKGKHVHQDDYDADSCTGRMILMTSHRDLKLNGITENMLTQTYLADHYPIGLGLSWWHGGCDRFLGRFKDFDRYHCLDAKKFDANINGWMVRMAIDVIRRQFLNGADAQYDAYWDFVYDGMVQTTLYRDDGLCFRKYVGSNSGHPLNSLLQSIITLIIAYAAMLLLNPDLPPEEVFSHVWVESLGDDNIIGIRDSHKICSDGLDTVANIYFRIDWSGKKSFSTDRFLGDKFDGVQFLGKYFRKATMLDGDAYRLQAVIPFRPARETFLKLYFEPDRYRLPEDDQERLKYVYMRAVGHWYDCAGNPEMRKWMDGFLDWLETIMVGPPPTEWAPEILQWFTRGHRGMEVPKCGRISYDKWIRLVIMP